eukprot:g13725.t1
MKKVAPAFANVQLDDHCETPRVAYEDIAPLLEAYALWRVRKLSAAGTSSSATGTATTFSSSSSTSPGLLRGSLRIYDPYFCTGQMKTHLANLGFHDVYNEPVDCYAQWKEPGIVDRFDALVTNPPYSGDHVLKLLDFCRKKCPKYVSERARGAGRGGAEASSTSSSATGPTPTAEQKNTSDSIPKLYLLCLPNYFYVKYANLCRDMKFVTPSCRYSYARLYKVSGKKTAPFGSLWYVLGSEEFFEFVESGGMPVAEEVQAQAARAVKSKLPLNAPNAGMSFAAQLAGVLEAEGCNGDASASAASSTEAESSRGAPSKTRREPLAKLVRAADIPDEWKAEEDPSRQYARKATNAKFEKTCGGTGIGG